MLEKAHPLRRRPRIWTLWSIRRVFSEGAGAAVFCLYTGCIA